MLLDIGPDTFVVPLARLADLTAHRTARGRGISGDTGGCAGHVPRRRAGAPAPALADRSVADADRAGRVYSIPVYLVLEVKDGIRESCTISMLVTDARQLDDAHSRQTVLEVRV